MNPDSVARDKNGEIYAVRYDALNAMLLNEFLKEHRKVEEQKATVAQLRRTFRPDSRSSESKLKRLLRTYRK